MRRRARRERLSAVELVARVDLEDHSRLARLADLGLSSLDHLRAILAVRRGRAEDWRPGHALPPGAARSEARRNANDPTTPKGSNP